MALQPTVSIAVRLVALNGMHGTDKSSIFLPNGRECLVKRVALLESRLAYFRSLLDLHATFEVWDQFLDHLRLLSTSVNNAIFVGSPLATVRDLCFICLSEFGFRIRPGTTLAELQRDQRWNDAVGGDAATLGRMIRTDFYYGNEPLPQVGHNRLGQLWTHGTDLVRKASDVPFGSLAHAISRTLDRPITLWALNTLEHAGRQKRAIRYTRKTLEGREEIIFYSPSQSCPSALDFWTRYEVAHELAHVALNHPPGDGHKDRAQELEAHYLAAVFLRLHGAPKNPVYPSDSELREILGGTDLSDTEKNLVVAHIEAILHSRSTEQLVESEVFPIDEICMAISAALDRYKNDNEFREQINEEVGNALAAL